MDKQKYDIGIFGLWYGRNYGSISTYFALRTVVEDMGYSTVMIENPLNKDSLKIESLPESHPRRFAMNHYEITPRYRLTDMQKLNSLCKGFLLGSDQMWNYGLSKPYKQSYFLDFAESDSVKIAYGTSFGKEPYNGPASEKPKIKKNLMHFSGLSVRDDFSKRILEKEFQLEAVQVMDPVFLCPVSAYEGLIEEIDPIPFKDYIFAYILDPNKEIGQSLLKILEVSGKKMVIAFDEAADKQEKLKLLGIEHPDLIVLQDPPVNMWMACYQKADFVLTDSFHGACFSIIFHRPFIVLRNNKRGGGRFSSLLDPIGLGNSMVTEPLQIGQKYLGLGEDTDYIDYEIVEQKIAPERDRSYCWLMEKLYPLHSKAVTSQLRKTMCSGCGACVAACPVDALSLKMDEWGYYRSSLDSEKCIECGKCAKVCPGISLPENQNTTNAACYEFVSSDDEVLRKSSSGGVFTALASEIFSKNGVVVGAAWKDDLTVEHIIIEKEADLWKLQKSKYLQSYIGTCLKKVKEYLDAGRYVLFSGTPCQVTGLRAYLAKEYDNLIAVDLLCGNAPSTMFFKKYLDYTFGYEVKSYQFRYKSDEVKWDAFHIRAEMEDGEEMIHNGAREDDYQRVYHNHTMCAPHCEKCRYQAFPRVGDLTIGDFWGISKLDPSLDTFKGVSLVLANNTKGRLFFEAIPEEKSRVKKKVPLSWMGGNGYSRNGGHNFCSPQRDEFYDAILTMPFGEAVNYALKPNHGKFRKAYRNSNTPLRFDRTMLRFKAENSIWEEHMIEGCPTLIVKSNKWKENGHYARLSMSCMLKRGQKYKLSAKFRIKSNADILNFHLIDSGGKTNQVIHTEEIRGRNDGQTWIEFSDVFEPNAGFYDEFMFGAAQVSGPNNFLMIAYINISESI